MELATYLPAGGTVTLNLSGTSDLKSFWFDPRTGWMKEASKAVKEKITRFGREGKDDWVLVLRKKR